MKHQLVQRCALHWRYITTKRRTQKGDNPCRTVIDQDQFQAKDLDYVPKLKPQAVEKLRQGNTSKTVPSHPLVSTSPKRLSEKDADFSSIRWDLSRYKLMYCRTLFFDSKTSFLKFLMIVSKNE